MDISISKDLPIIMQGTINHYSSGSNPHTNNLEDRY